MTLEMLKNKLPEVIKDTKINLERVFTEDTVLTKEETALITLACSYALSNNDLLMAAKNHFASEVGETLLNAAKICATIMAMNNVYYRFTHLVQDKSFSSMNPMLRMSGLGNHGADKIAFELASLAVSALNGCGMCMDAHTEKLKKDAASLEKIQAAVRIAAVLNATAVGLGM